MILVLCCKLICTSLFRFYIISKIMYVSLIYFAQNELSRSICVAVNGIILFFLWLSNIPLYHIFIHSSAEGHLGGSHVLAVVNSAAMNVGVCVSF